MTTTTKKNLARVRPFYTCGQLARLCGYTTTGMRRFMKKIPFLGDKADRLGSKWIFYLCDLEMYAPRLYSSIIMASSLNEAVADDDDLI